MKLHTLWALLDEDLANEILGLVQKSNKKLYTTAVDLLCRPMKMRAVKVLEMPRKERHRTWAGLLGDPALEPLSLNLFGEWLMGSQREMLVEWTEALGMEHDGKGFVKKFPPSPPREKLEQAVGRMLDSFPPANVLIHLMVFNKDAGWPDLEAVITADARLTVMKMRELS